MKSRLSVFTCKQFTGHYPVPVAAVVIDKSAEAAADRLNGLLRRDGLVGDATAEDMNHLCEAIVHEGMAGAVELLSNGNY